MTASDTINVCLATDRNYLQHAGAVIASVLKCARPEDKLTFYILQDNLNAKDRMVLKKLNSIKACEFKFITPDFNNLPEGKFLKYISRSSLLRLQLSSLLPELERVIYLDCDVIVMSSLGELWDIDLGDKIGAGVADYNATLSEHQKSINCENSVYINSGVLMLNLALIRNQNIEAAFLNTATELKERATLLDQDIINKTLENKIHILPLKWNLSTGYFKRRYELQYYTDKEIIEAARAPGILHFSGKKKPWLWRRCRHSYWFEYFNALKGTPWKHKYWQGIVKKIFFPCRQIHGPAAGKP